MSEQAAVLRRLWVVNPCARKAIPSPKCIVSLSPNQGVRPAIPVDTVVIHCTAGATSAGAMSRLMDASARASSHLLIPDPRRGEPLIATRLVPDHRKAWHVRREVVFQGRKDVNARSLGMEIVNPGRVDTPYDDWSVEEAARWTAFWLGQFPIQYVVTHAWLDPERRRDPCATFPWSRYIQLVERFQAVSP